MKKILLIGFQNQDENMYPHLKCFIDQLSLYCNVDYFYFRERGYFVEEIINNPSLRAYIRLRRPLFYSLKDYIKLKFGPKDYTVVIAVDHYAYAIATLIFDNVIFWSHDIISPELTMYKHWFVKYYMDLCAKGLRKNKKLIIQDDDRLALILNSLKLENFKPDVFQMPVFLEKVDAAPRSLSSVDRPFVIQCGGIGKYRQSDKLLQHYQTNFNHYRLFFHGYLAWELIDDIRSCERKPVVSNFTVPSKYLYQIINNCDIGFVGYSQQDSNFFYIAKASGQFVEFTRVGIPVIVMGKTNLNNFVTEQSIGVAIEDISELNSAIETIKNNYDSFSANSLKCFNTYFNHEKYIPAIVEWL